MYRLLLVILGVAVFVVGVTFGVVVDVLSDYSFTTEKNVLRSKKGVILYCQPYDVRYAKVYGLIVKPINTTLFTSVKVIGSDILLYSDTLYIVIGENATLKEPGHCIYAYGDVTIIEYRGMKLFFPFFTGFAALCAFLGYVVYSERRNEKSSDIEDFY